MNKLLLLIFFLIISLSVFGLDLTIDGKTYKNVSIRPAKGGIGYVKLYYDGGIGTFPVEKLPPIDLKTKDGKEYKNAKLSNVSKRGIDLSYDGKLKFLDYKKLSDAHGAYFKKRSLVQVDPALMTVNSESHQIKLRRPAKEGSKYSCDLKITDDIDNKTLKGDQVIKREKVSGKITFQSDLTVNKVDDKGRPTDITCTVKKFEGMTDGKTQELLPAGAVFKAFSQDKKVNFEMDGKPVDQKTYAMLAPLQLITVDPSSATDDEVFMTEQKRKFGETWEIDKERVLEDLKKSDVAQNIALANITGKSILKKKTKLSNGIPALFLTSQMKIDNFVFPTRPLNATVKEASMTNQVSFKVPEDTSLEDIETMEKVITKDKFETSENNNTVLIDRSQTKTIFQKIYPIK